MGQDQHVRQCCRCKLTKRALPAFNQLAKDGALDVAVAAANANSAAASPSAYHNVMIEPLVDKVSHRKGVLLLRQAVALDRIGLI